MRLTSIQQNGHRKGPIPNGSDAYHAGRSAMEVCMLGFQKTDGIYYIKPTANNAAQQVYCDMTTDGGGWMLIARTDPRASTTSAPWGWMAAARGGLTDFSQPYLLGWVNWHNAGARFTEYIYGNRKNINNNAWGPFIYKRNGFSSAVANGYDGMYSSNFYGYLSLTMVKYDLSIYNLIGGPGMQNLQGGMQDNGFYNIYMRDVLGNGDQGYGLHCNGLYTTYINNTDPAINGGTGWQLAGPWGIAAGTYNSSTGDFDQATGNPQYGGTSQAMIMVRHKGSQY